MSIAERMAAADEIIYQAKGTRMLQPTVYLGLSKTGQVVDYCSRA